MAAQMIANHRENAETYTGDEICKAKSLELLHEISLPDGLLPLEDIIEVGYNRTSGFVWLRQKKKKEHYFKSIGKPVSYATEVTAFVEKHRMKKITGVKSKDTMLWVNISDIFISDPSSGKITFKTPFGLSRTFPVSAFVNEETEEEKKRKKERAEEEEKKKKMEEEAEEEKEKTRKQTDEEKKMMEEVEAEEKKKENAEDEEKKKMDEVEDEEKKKMMEENEEEKKVENVEDQEKKKMEKVEVDEEKKKIEEVKA